MLKNYFKTALRNMRKNKSSALINIVGLSVGMAVVMLISLWVWNELSFNKYHKNYDRIAEVMLNQTFNGTISTGVTIPVALDQEMRKTYGSDFKHIAMSSWADVHILATADKKISCRGNFMSPEAPELFSLHMLHGKRNGLTGLNTTLISASMAKALFGNEDPMGRLAKMDNGNSFTITGVYEDLPENTSLHETAFIAPWDYYTKNTLNPRTMTDWGDDSWMMYVEIADHADMSTVSEKIKNLILKKSDPRDARFKPMIFLQPMSNWHLYNEFKDGINTGGAIQYVWLFGIIGVFVLLLACINFMNLSTARSEKRAKEVGIRKAVGSLRSQLISQFYIESLITALGAFIFSLALVLIILPFFNEVAGKKINILWTNPVFWIMGIGFTSITGLIAGSYPALYLSGFQPVKVLKGHFKAGRLAAIPRKLLVVLQFTVSATLIIGTIIVFNQIQFTRNRPVGYSRDALIDLELTNNDLMNSFYQVRADMLQSGAVKEVAQSSSNTSGVNNNRSGLEWKGKDPAMTDDFANIRVTTEYGKTVSWQVTEGRDFSSQMLTDSSGLVLNEAAVQYMGLKNPIGETVRFGNRDHHVIGVVKNMVVQSPYEPVKQAIYYITNEDFGYVIIRINPNMNTHDALKKIKAVCEAYSPSVPFSYRFADEEYARKFSDEERIGKLAGFFSTLAIFISCLGLFGMASYMAEQRIKEFGVRKVLGAGIFNLWALMSKDFVQLVIVALLIAIPFSWYFMNNWLTHYSYRATIPWWAFASTGLGAIIITVCTVSFQAIKAAMINPVESLKTE